MIFNLILGVIYLFVVGLEALLSPLGTVTLDPQFALSIQHALPYIQSLSLIFPVSTLFAIIAFDVLFETAYFGYKVIKWIYQKIPGVS